MNKQAKWTFIIGMLLTVGIWLFTPNSHPFWIKHTVLGALCLYQVIIFFVFARMKTPAKEERYFGLTEKLYLLTLFLAMAVYTKGLWAILPFTWVTHLSCGTSLAIITLFFLYFAFKKVEEQPDERFYADLAKAACLTLIALLLCFMVLSVFAFFIPFTLKAGMILIFSAIMILVFDLAFFFFEKRGD